MPENAQKPPPERVDLVAQLIARLKAESRNSDAVLVEKLVAERDWARRWAFMLALTAAFLFFAGLVFADAVHG